MHLTAHFALLAEACGPDPYHVKPPEVLRLEDPTFSLFHILTLAIFLLAIIHTFVAVKIASLAKRLEKNASKKALIGIKALSYLGEVEVIFALWTIPLFF